MVTFGQKQREMLADKLMDLGNLAAGSLIFGTILREESLAFYPIIAGMIVITGSYLLSILFTKNH